MSKKEGKDADGPSLYRELNTHRQNEDYEKAIKVCCSFMFYSLKSRDPNHSDPRIFFLLLP